MPTHTPPHTTPDLAWLLAEVVTVVYEAGNRLLASFPPSEIPTTNTGIAQAIAANDATSRLAIESRLTAVLPNAAIADDLLSKVLAPGEWWVVDWVEGNINHVQGHSDWGITIALVRDNAPVLAVAHFPVAQETYTAIVGQGAHLNGKRIAVSAKADLDAAIVATAQATPHDTFDNNHLLGTSVIAMQNAVLLVRVSVPSTVQLVQVAAGRIDGFWQHTNQPGGVVAGALFVSEAGGVLTDLHGDPWTLASSDFLASCPKLTDAIVNVLQPFVRSAESTKRQATDSLNGDDQ
jgi:myo-inositol-1(or 4)-monophosphatase